MRQKVSSSRRMAPNKPENNLSEPLTNAQESNRQQREEEGKLLQQKCNSVIIQQAANKARKSSLKTLPTRMV